MFNCAQILGTVRAKYTKAAEVVTMNPPGSNYCVSCRLRGRSAWERADAEGGSRPEEEDHAVGDFIAFPPHQARFRVGISPINRGRTMLNFTQAFYRHSLDVAAAWLGDHTARSCGVLVSAPRGRTQADSRS